jgi:hypothetical protein
MIVYLTDPATLMYATTFVAGLLLARDWFRQ